MFSNMGSSSGPPLFDHLRSAFPNLSYLDGFIVCSNYSDERSNSRQHARPQANTITASANAISPSELEDETMLLYAFIVCLFIAT